VLHDYRQSKLSQEQLAELQKSTHFDKKELQQWYKGEQLPDPRQGGCRMLEPLIPSISSAFRRHDGKPLMRRHKMRKPKKKASSGF
jgi:hypothetical protein